MLTFLYSCVCSDLVVQVKCSTLCVSVASLSPASLRHDHCAPGSTFQSTTNTRKVRVRKIQRHWKQWAFGRYYVVLQPANACEVMNRCSWSYGLITVVITIESRMSRSVVYEGSVVNSVAHLGYQCSDSDELVDWVGTVDPNCPLRYTSVYPGNESF